MASAEVRRFDAIQLKVMAQSRQIWFYQLFRWLTVARYRRESLPACSPSCSPSTIYGPRWAQPLNAMSRCHDYPWPPGIRHTGTVEG
jgi:hypothetical protein